MTPRPMATARTTCRLCSSFRLRNIIPLSPLPVASPNVGRSGTMHETAAADVWQCQDCGHIQLATVVDPAFQYRNFRYSTGISLGLREHFARLIDILAERGGVTPGRFVVDIGSNDGSLLRFAANRGARVLGIDPAETIALAATQAGIETLPRFFDAELGSDIARSYGRADVVVSNNTVANIDDLGSFFTGLDAILADDGILVIETQYALDVMTKTLLDVIYHEHVSYFSVKPVQRFLRARGYELIDAVRIAPKGGSVRFIVQREGHARRVAESVETLIAEEDGAGLYDGRLVGAFNGRIGSLRADICERLELTRAATGRALAYGASVGCAALIHYFDLGSRIDAIFDDSPLTNLVRTAEGDIPVLSGSQLGNEMGCDVAVLAWRYAAPIARGHTQFCRDGGRFFRVLPDLAYVDGGDAAPLVG